MTIRVLLHVILILKQTTLVRTRRNTVTKWV